MSDNHKSNSNFVGFRLSAEQMEKLRALAREMSAPKLNTCARAIFLRALDPETEITKLRQSIARLRADLATGITAILIKIGKMEPNQALAWVKQNIERDEK